MHDIEFLRKELACWANELRVLRMENVAMRVMINAIINAHPIPDELAASLDRSNELFVAQALGTPLPDEDREALSEQVRLAAKAVRALREC